MQKREYTRTRAHTAALPLRKNRARYPIETIPRIIQKNEWAFSRFFPFRILGTNGRTRPAMYNAPEIYASVRFPAPK